jgi:hypothetical protein
MPWACKRWPISPWICSGKHIATPVGAAGRLVVKPRCRACAAEPEGENEVNKHEEQDDKDQVHGRRARPESAELMGHQRLETTRSYTLPAAEDRERVINSIPRDR